MNHTWKRNLLMPSTNCVLNPHGSDKTRPRPNYIEKHKRLLNPHGSDETDVFLNSQLHLPKFLTHTVQMKLSLTELSWIISICS